MTLATLIVMRHAKSSWHSDAPNDYERPLSARGKRDARVMGRWLSDNNYRLQKIISSPAARAKHTTDIVAKSMNQSSATLVEWCEPIYNADLSALLGILNRNLADDSLMIVGHNPGMESLIEYLDPDINDRVRQQKLVPTAGLFVFRISLKEGLIGRGSGQLMSHQRPKSVHAKVRSDTGD